MKDRSQFVEVLKRFLAASNFDLRQQVLVIGGSSDDELALSRAGLRSVSLSTFETSRTQPNGRFLDVEDLSLADESADVVVLHEVLHHCRSPHRGLCESLRVARHCVIFMEPNDSMVMRLLQRLALSSPYEIDAVVAHAGLRGGVRDTSVPNYVFRWRASEVFKLAASFRPEFETNIYADPYWEFNVDASEIKRRCAPSLKRAVGIVGAENLIYGLGSMQRLLNSLPLLRRQGNKFFCAVIKNQQLKSWLAPHGGGIILKTSSEEPGRPGSVPREFE